MNENFRTPPAPAPILPELSPDTLQICLILFVAIALLGALGFILRGRLGARGLLAFNMLGMLLAVFGALLIAEPDSKLSRWATMGGMLACYWLLSRFEGTEKK